MRVSHKQMETIKKSQQKKFEERLTTFLKKTFPDARTTSKDKLLLQVCKQLENAREYHLETERQIVTYITTAWLLGEKFDKEFPGAHAILTSPKLAPDMKSEYLAQWTKEIFSTLETNLCSGQVQPDTLI